eukprot:COSAG01_NODE_3128_length_6541_cov_14.744334_2_plen_199_part_00
MPSAPTAELDEDGAVGAIGFAPVGCAAVGPPVTATVGAAAAAAVAVVACGGSADSLVSSADGSRRGGCGPTEPGVADDDAAGDAEGAGAGGGCLCSALSGLTIEPSTGSVMTSRCEQDCPFAVVGTCASGACAEEEEEEEEEEEAALPGLAVLIAPVPGGAAAFGGVRGSDAPAYTSATGQSDQRSLCSHTARVCGCA